MESLKNKTIIVTGASSGVGNALSLKLAKKGCNLVLCARRFEKLQSLSENIETINPNAKVLIVKTDVSKEEDIRNLFKETIEKFGKVDILINNAGKGFPSLVHDISNRDWKKVMDTNLTSVFLCSKEAIKDMFKNNTKGHIITVCSIAGLYGAPGYSAYCASKHAVAGFKRSLWLELRKKGIKVSTVYPARIDTEFFKDYKKKPTKNQMVSPKDIADYIVTIAERDQMKRIMKKVDLIYKRIKNFVF